jgi:hypothetical protein
MGEADERERMGGPDEHFAAATGLKVAGGKEILRGLVDLAARCSSLG